MTTDRPENLDHPKDCDHEWQPVSFVLETRLVGDERGRYAIAPFPDQDKGRVYLVCMLCASHTYIETSWIGHRFEGSVDREPRSPEP